MSAQLVSHCCCVFLLIGAAWTEAQRTLEGCRGDEGVRLSSDVYACRGEWSGHVENASGLCAPAYRVCRWDDAATVGRLQAEHVAPFRFPGGELSDVCYAYSAAQNRDGCGPCGGRRGDSDEMAGVGQRCHFESYRRLRNRSCLATGKVSHDQGMRPDGAPGCTFLRHHTSGVVCCRNGTSTTAGAPPSMEPETQPTAGRLNVQWTEDHLYTFVDGETDTGPHQQPSLERERQHHTDGCTAGNRSGLFRLRDVATCNGSWRGHVRNADDLCAPGWKVCNHTNQYQLGLIDFSHSKKKGLPGCFAVYAAHGRGSPCRLCHEGGSTPIQMAGVGRDCDWQNRARKDSRKEQSCFGKGRVDATSYRPGRECSFDFSLTGVVCCRKEFRQPCESSCVHGHCNTTQPDGNGICICHPGWKGSSCDIAICHRKCRHGMCIAPETCRCREGYAGKPCRPVPCYAGCVNGVCNTTDTRHGVCQCRAGWAGIACNKPVCTQGCQNGECIAPNRCLCSEGWKGSMCHRPICRPACEWGRCIAPDKCKCKKGWSGERCLKPICEPPCPPLAGRCLVPNYCICFDNFMGRSCEIRRSNRWATTDSYINR